VVQDMDGDPVSRFPDTDRLSFCGEHETKLEKLEVAG